MMKLQHPANALRLKEELEAVQAARATLAAEVDRLTAELADARAQLDAATKLNTDLLNDAIRLMGRVNELEEAGEVWRPAPPQE